MNNRSFPLCLLQKKLSPASCPSLLSEFKTERAESRCDQVGRQYFARLVLADHLVVRGRLDDAQHQLGAILSKAPCALAHLKLGLILDLAGNQEGAKEEFIACTHLDPLRPNGRHWKRQTQISPLESMTSFSGLQLVPQMANTKSWCSADFGKMPTFGDTELLRPSTETTRM